MPVQQYRFRVVFSHSTLLGSQMFSITIDEIKKSFVMNLRIPKDKREEFKKDVDNIVKFEFNELDNNDNAITSETYILDKIIGRSRTFDYSSSDAVLETIEGLYK